jgi:tripartite motif-containing protein 37
MKSRLISLLAQKQSISEEIDFLEGMQVEVTRQVKDVPKSQLITKSHETVRMLQDMTRKPLPAFNSASISLDFPSELVPSYDSTTFILRNYSRVRDTNEVVYSEPFAARGNTWRLKIYPCGNGAAKDTYISVFLEMVKGLHKISKKYEYRVEMLNTRYPTNIVVREFASDFQPGECWGYNRFFKLEALEREGYYNPEDDQVLLQDSPPSRYLS